MNCNFLPKFTLFRHPLRAGLSYDFLYINGLKTYLGPAAEIFVSYKFSFAGKGNNSQTLY
jgi:hypothetical protein